MLDTLIGDVITKKCTKCGNILPATADYFYRDRKFKSGLHYDCKLCRKKYVDSRSEYIKEYKRKNHLKLRESSRWRAISRKYGVTREWYNERELEQGGVCAICGNLESMVDKRTGEVLNLSVDHNHETGTIRGLLCSRCNLGLGLLESSLKSVINYLDIYGV